MNKRQELIKKIAEKRDTNVVTYITADRPNVNAIMEPNDIRVFRDHLDGLSNSKPIDLFIFSNGGVSTTAWALVNLLREYTDKLTVLIPYKAFSCATSVAIGADEILMGKLGTLGPIDPTVANEFNPIVNGRRVGISVEDISAYSGLAKSIFGLRRQPQVSEVFTQLATDIKPLALGNAYRHYLKARDDAHKLLGLHTKSLIDKYKARKVVATLVEKLYFHGHHINRKEAKSIGLKIMEPDEIVESLMWDLYLEYEKDLDFKNPYQDTITSGRDIVLCAIESESRSDRRAAQQKITTMNFPQDAKLTVVDGQPAILMGTTLLGIQTQGTAVVVDGKVCDKVENVRWITEEQSENQSQPTQVTLAESGEDKPVTIKDISTEITQKPADLPTQE